MQTPAPFRLLAVARGRADAEAEEAEDAAVSGGARGDAQGRADA
ncbi:hypothetical protein QE392_001708 [Microbacterium proteolyticum]|nr:hypothetical protein [Microbacterium proteolyticum]MDQ1169904.1 hypothetical protein [Microbacterium proteolyticum]